MPAPRRDKTVAGTTIEGMAGLCDIERCYNKGTYELDQTSNYWLCATHEQEWRGSGLRLRTNPKKHTLKLVEVILTDT